MPLVLLRRTALAVALGVLIQQFAIADSTGGAQVLDLSSPESALRSYWAIKDRRPHPNHSQDSETTAFLKDMAMVTAGETQKYFLAWEPSPPYRVSRTIKSTSEESPSRVVLLVNVKNISTVPAGATPTATVSTAI
jgi:hypothetical protein